MNEHIVRIRQPNIIIDSCLYGKGQKTKSFIPIDDNDMSRTYIHVISNILLKPTN